LVGRLKPRANNIAVEKATAAWKLYMSLTNRLNGRVRNAFFKILLSRSLRFVTLNRLSEKFGGKLIAAFKRWRLIAARNLGALNAQKLARFCLLQSR
jgi:hypothetical protein